MRTATFLWTLSLAALTGCAGYKIQPLSAAAHEPWTQPNPKSGYVFYQPELYFLVTPAASSNKPTPSTNSPAAASAPAANADPGFTVTPLYLPNPQKAYQVTTHNFLAKSDFTFNFKDGWQLTSIADKADNSTIANTLAGELKTVLSATGLPAAMTQLGKNPVKSFLLHPKYNDEGVITSFEVVPLPQTTTVN